MPATLIPGTEQVFSHCSEHLINFVSSIMGTI